MLALKPQFVVFTGDNVYYDADAPGARTPRLARYHWERMFSLPREVELLRKAVAGQHSAGEKQERRIAALERENCALRAYVYGLARLLSRKGAVGQDDLRRLENEAERAGR